MDENLRTRARKRISSYPEHMRAALDIALELSEAQFRERPPSQLDIELHIDCLAALFAIPGSGEAFVRSWSKGTTTP